MRYFQNAQFKQLLIRTNGQLDTSGYITVFMLKDCTIYGTHYRKGHNWSVTNDDLLYDYKEIIPLNRRFN